MGYTRTEENMKRTAHNRTLWSRLFVTIWSLCLLAWSFSCSRSDSLMVKSTQEIRILVSHSTYFWLSDLWYPLVSNAIKGDSSLQNCLQESNGSTHGVWLCIRPFNVEMEISTKKKQSFMNHSIRSKTIDSSICRDLNEDCPGKLLASLLSQRDDVWAPLGWMLALLYQPRPQLKVLLTTFFPLSTLRFSWCKRLGIYITTQFDFVHPETTRMKGATLPNWESTLQNLAVLKSCCKVKVSKHQGLFAVSKTQRKIQTPLDFLQINTFVPPMQTLSYCT